ncbi:Zn-ribbon containing protein [Halopenitus sp. POP-27]|uniref:Zn-ribbon domain-containing protein n=1 Tax=Halopenitus sp. POP-27 TaxID=2994425 RepID=UPI002468A321|nr:Zn-ribbon containing protein [Halopenitus sp. POP-27]
MPHQCTSCGHVFPDGSKEMLSGCPDCGGNKFQFKPGSVDDAGGSGTDRSGSPTTDENVTIDPDSGTDGPASASTDSSSPSADAGSSSPSADDSAAAGTAPDRDAEVTMTPDDEVPDDAAEDDAQASARSEIVSPDELAVSESSGSGTSSPQDGDETREAAGTRPDDATEPDDATDPDGDVDTAESDSGLDALREELNDQFESIRIVSPGQYELNLMELYDRQEYIISLQEDGRYVIEMPGDWGPDDE